MPLGEKARSRKKIRGSREEPESGARSEIPRELGPIYLIGWVLMVSVLGGTLGGVYLDRRLGTTPWLTLLGIFVGMAAGFLSFFRTLQEQEKRRQRPGDHRGTDDDATTR